MTDADELRRSARHMDALARAFSIHAANTDGAVSMAWNEAALRILDAGEALAQQADREDAMWTAPPGQPVLVQFREIGQ